MGKFANRLKKARTDKRIGSVELGKLLNMGNSAVSRWESGQREPNLDTIKEIAKILNTTVAYLMGETADPAQPIAINKTIRHEVIETEIINVPIVNPNITACAGGGNGYYNVEWTAVAIRPIPVKELLGHLWQRNSESLKIITLEGKSMEPKYHNGDQILFIESELISSSDVIIAIWDDRLYMRGFFIEGDEIVLKPRNPVAENIRADKDDPRLQIIGKVIARVPQIEPDGGFYS